MSDNPRPLMQHLSDLSALSHPRKDELILQLWKTVQTMRAQITELQARLNLNSQNSSKPPSSDGLNKPKPKSLRKAGQRPVGGQIGHKGNTLCQVAEPDKIITHAPPARCDACRSPLGPACVVERRQVFELPVMHFDVIEHRVLQAQCRCGKVHRGRFPDFVGAAAQYGPRAQAAVHLNQHHMVPLKRTADLMSGFFGLPMSQTQVIRAAAQAASLLAPTVQAIAQAFAHQPTVHADETGLRVNKSLHWMHALVTDKLTWVGRHTKRGMDAFVDFGVLPLFKGTLVHDGLASYRKLDCTHSLCNAHHLRELTWVYEELGQAWAGAMIALLIEANDLYRSRRAADPIDYAAPGYVLELRALRSRYDAILDEGDHVNPRVQPSGKSGRPAQSKAANLIGRLREHGDDVWRFMSQPGVPFTNNLAGQAVRMSKVKQKISGCWRTSEGADVYCIIRSYLATMHKQGVDLLDALTQAFRGAPPQPSFGLWVVDLAFVVTVLRWQRVPMRKRLHFLIHGKQVIPYALRPWLPLRFSSHREAQCKDRERAPNDHALQNDLKDQTMSHLLLSDVQATNLQTLYTIRLGVERDLVDTCRKFARQAQKLRALNPEQLLTLVQRIGQTSLFVPRADLIALIEAPGLLASALAAVRPPVPTVPLQT